MESVTSTFEAFAETHRYRIWTGVVGPSAKKGIEVERRCLALQIGEPEIIQNGKGEACSWFLDGCWIQAHGKELHVHWLEVGTATPFNPHVMYS